MQWFVHEGFFHRFRVSINHRQVGAHRAFRTPAPLLSLLTGRWNTSTIINKEAKPQET
jgi:hypothetical protein